MVLLELLTLLKGMGGLWSCKINLMRNARACAKHNLALKKIKNKVWIRSVWNNLTYQSEIFELAQRKPSFKSENFLYKTELHSRKF